MNNNLTPKRMFMLSGLFLVGCCGSIEPSKISTCESSYYQCDTQIMPIEKPVTTHQYYQPIHKPRVVNNTPHIKRQALPKQYTEQPKDFGLVDMNGRVL